tara:strand:+ start:5639 stop:7201 length:1563 start_codon:yes stop_codon:yes gene_type:complete
MNSWKNTRKSFVNWLSNSELRKKFCDNIKYENLSFWWLTLLMDKDNINQTYWYESLNKKLNSEKNFLFTDKINYFSLTLLLIKKFISKIASIIIIKVLFKTKTKKTENNCIQNCFYTMYTNMIQHNGNFIDRQYGLTSIKNIKTKNYIVEIPENFYLIKNFKIIKKNLKNIPVGFIIVNKNIKIFDILRVYFLCLIMLFKTLKILREKNYFIINNKDCKDVLEKKLLRSFFGSIQDQLLKGIALKNSLNLISAKNFINCFDFHPQARAFYYFSKNSSSKNIININHANYSENNIFFNYDPNDFSKIYSSYYSPKPDIYLCQGERYFKVVKKFLDHDRVFRLGSLKIELNKFKLEDYKISNKVNSKKTITILCSINDYQSFVRLLNESNLNELNIYVAPHPLKKIETIKYFRENLKMNFIDATDLDKNNIFKISDYIIFGDTSLGLELALKNYNIFRMYHHDYIPTFDIDDEIPTATNNLEILELLKKNKITQNPKKIETDYFYKYDMNASNRLEQILDEL